jgi:hypothetical protein
MGQTVGLRYDALPTPNLPRSVFLKRESFPLVWSSLSIADMRVIDAGAANDATQRQHSYLACGRTSS